MWGSGSGADIIERLAGFSIFCMHLREALEVLNEPADGPGFPVVLACGFSPLHLATFLTAHTRNRRNGEKVEVRTGLFDDLAGTLASCQANAAQGVFVLVEWPDLDPRLGLRQLGGWAPASVPEIVESARRKLESIETSLRGLARTCPLVLAPPLLDLPPLFFTRRQQLHPEAARLREFVSGFVTRSAEARIRVLDPNSLPSVPRFDLRGYLSTGFPYTLEFASVLAEHLANLLLPPAPKKGLITDLDDTLWRGILGEVGAANVHWDLNGKAQIHGIYQTLLQSLADAGVLIGIVTKNDPANVSEVLGRSDLLLSPRSVFPVEAGWGPKSESVARILRAWNIGEDAVVFIDDSPMELAQVASVFPSMTTMLFPTRETGAFWETLGLLRDLFGRSVISDEDRIRAESLRSGAELERVLESGGAGIDDFLAQAEAVMELVPLEPGDERALELVNKTNQFNLNGRRRTEAEWRRMLENSSAAAFAVSYRDKYGPLGKIAILAGEQTDEAVRLHTWVMSCRAFSRRIEFQCLKCLFEEYGCKRIELDFVATAKNGPLQEFVRVVSDASGTVTPASLAAASPALFHTVRGCVRLSHERT
jgi:FkbH-like protein